jgi:F-type H+-transporting ATPase subunit b
MELLNPIEIIVQIICFLMLFFLLRLLLWGRFLGLLDARKKQIADELKSIDAAKADVEKLKQDFAEKLGHIEDIAAATVKGAVEKGQEAAAEIKDRARQEAQQIIVEAKEEMEQTVVKTKEELKKQVVELTLLATEKLIEEKLTAADDRKLVANFVKQLEDEHGG